MLRLLVQDDSQKRLVDFDSAVVAVLARPSLPCHSEQQKFGPISSPCG
jgi:hypothetical protein